MDNKLVLVKEIKTATTKTNKEYTQVFDQDEFQWNFWNGEQLEQNKAYVFGYEIEKGFANVKQITPVTNILHQKALKEVASRETILRNYSVCFSYAKDLAVAGKIAIGEIEENANRFYDEFQAFADSKMPKE